MPAGSEPRPALPVSWRPLGPRIAGLVAGGGLLVVTTFLWIGFDDQTRRAITWPQRLTVIAFFVLVAVCLYALIRSRATAHDGGLTVVNGYRRHELEWAQIVSVHLGQGAPWVVLDLADGEVLSVMGIQGSDGGRARAAVRALRAIVEAETDRRGRASADPDTPGD